MSTPYVSVCLPNFNYARFLGACLESIRAQTQIDFELVVVDDASTDASVQVIEEHRDDRFRFFRHEKRLGAVATWNHCLEMARGDYISFICADDLFLPGKLLHQLQVFEQDPSIGIVHTGGYWVNESGEREIAFSEVFPPDLQEYLAEDHITPSPLELRRLAVGYNYIHLSNAMFRRRCIATTGGFSSRFPYAADWDMWLRIAERYAVGYLAQHLAAYRRHGDNLTLHMQRTGQEFRDWYGVTQAVFKRWPAQAGESDSLKQQAHTVIREHLLRRIHNNYHAGRNREVCRELLLGFCRDPLIRTDRLSVKTFVKSLSGGRSTKRRLQEWGVFRRPGAETAHDE